MAKKPKQLDSTKPENPNAKEGEPGHLPPAVRQNALKLDKIPKSKLKEPTNG